MLNGNIFATKLQFDNCVWVFEITLEMSKIIAKSKLAAFIRWKYSVVLTIVLFFAFALCLTSFPHTPSLPLFLQSAGFFIINYYFWSWLLSDFILHSKNLSSHLLKNLFLY